MKKPLKTSCAHVYFLPLTSQSAHRIPWQSPRKMWWTLVVIFMLRFQRCSERCTSLLDEVTEGDFCLPTWMISTTGYLRNMPWYPYFNGSHFGLPPRSIPKMTGLSGMPKIVWTMTYAHYQPVPPLSVIDSKGGVFGLGLDFSFLYMPYTSSLYSLKKINDLDRQTEGLYRMTSSPTKPLACKPPAHPCTQLTFPLMSTSSRPFQVFRFLFAETCTQTIYTSCQESSSVAWTNSRTCKKWDFWSGVKSFDEGILNYWQILCLIKITMLPEFVVWSLLPS